MAPGRPDAESTCLGEQTLKQKKTKHPKNKTSNKTEKKTPIVSWARQILWASMDIGEMDNHNNNPDAVRSWVE